MPQAFSLAKGRAILIATTIGVGIDVNAQGPVVTLTASDYSGYNIACFGAQDGAIDAAVSGGTPPYSYAWTNGATTEDISDVASGYYKLTVTDANSVTTEADITLTEPKPLEIDMVPFKYPSGLNISCYECYNGSIDVSVTGGVPPYTYNWGDDVTTQDRSGLGAMPYGVVVLDANGCGTKAGTYLKQPDSDDWKMGGNANTDPSTQYLGTSDAQDVVLKSNGQEMIRLKSNGDLSLLGSLGTGILYRDPDGKLRGGGWPPGPSLGPCQGLEFTPFWETRGNAFDGVCEEEIPLLGTLGERHLNVITNNVMRLRITTDGLVGIGPNLPMEDQFEVHTTLERSGITLVNDAAGSNAHTEIRFKEGEVGRWALGCDFEANGGQDFFLWDQLGGAKRIVVNAQGKVGIGTEPPANSSLYRLYVGDGIATRDVKVTALNWPDYVFQPNYALMAFSELRKFLAEKKHLPGIPSAAELQANEGYEVGDMLARMLKISEEQALYILQLEQRITMLEEERAARDNQR